MDVIGIVIWMMTEEEEERRDIDRPGDVMNGSLRVKTELRAVRSSSQPKTKQT